MGSTREPVLVLNLDSFIIFSPRPDATTWRAPDSLTRQYRWLVTRLGIRTTLHKLRHYSATELIAAGVDVRTVAGRLGHAEGGTTLAYYTAWLHEARPPRQRPTHHPPSDSPRPSCYLIGRSGDGLSLLE
jgi:integrase